MRWTNRPSGEELTAALAAWLAFIAGLLVGGGVQDIGSLAVASVAGALLVCMGFAAASRCRRIPRHDPVQRGRLAVVSIAAGTLLGIANLAANWTIARADPAIRSLLVERMNAIAPWEAVVGAPLVEEVLVRLFLMSGFAWIVLRLTRKTTLAFVTALVASALFFAILHLARPIPGNPAVATYYQMALLAKYMLAGLPLGWIFWRFGLPYAIACHAAANATHLALQGRVF